MQKNLKPLSNLKFFTGAENYEESNSVPPDKFYYTRNVRFVSKVLSSKLGYHQIGDTLAGGTEFQGMYTNPFWTGSAREETLFGFYNKSFYKFNETTQIWDIVPTTWPDVANVFTDGVVYNNILYVVNPLDITDAQVISIEVIDGGSLYTAPVITLTGGGSTGATASAVVNNGVITNISIVSGGAGYTSNPGITLTDGGPGTGATAICTISNGTVDSITITNGGSGYTSPTVVFSGGNFTTSASATAAFTNGVITAINVTSGGVPGFTSSPTVTITDGTGNGAVAAATITTANGIGKITNNDTFSVVVGPNTGTPRGIMIESWIERLWVAGDPQAPNAWICSKPALSSNPLAVEDFDTTNGAVTDLLGKGGQIVAMRVLNNEMYMFKQDSIYFNTIDRFAAGTTQFKQLSRTGGATNQKSTIVVENDIWFFDGTNNQVRSLGTERNLGQDPRTKALSEIIKRSMALLDPIQDNPVMSYNKRVVKLSLKTKGSPTNNFNIIFDYNTGGFSIDIGQGINVVTIYRSSVYYGEDSSGQAFKDDSGYTANGTAFPIQADTPFMDDSRPDLWKRSRYIFFKGKLSYDQDLYLRLYRDSNYAIYTTYYLKSPRARGIPLIVPDADGQWGASQRGGAEWGGSSTSTPDIQMYKIEDLISVSHISNMYAIGLFATIDGGKMECEQLVLKVIDENENYKRSNL